jgi:hypothetical protein
VTLHLLFAAALAIRKRARFVNRDGCRHCCHSRHAFLSYPTFRLPGINPVSALNDNASGLRSGRM